MNGVYDTGTLSADRRAFGIVQAFVSTVHYAALLAIGACFLVHLCDGNGLTWPGILLTIVGATTLLWLGSTINQGSGVLRYLDRWKQSIYRRQDLVDAAEALKAGEQVFVDFREVTLYEGVVVPKPGARTIIPSLDNCNLSPSIDDGTGQLAPLGAKSCSQGR